MSFTRKERDSLGAQSKESSGVQIQSHSQSNPRSQTPIAIRGDGSIQREDTGYKSIGLLKLRGKSDDLPQSWWFASTAIPLAAATIGPLANILSIAAIVSNWIDALPNNGQLPEGADENGVGIPDPTWEVVLNACSLVCGFVGNIFLLLNFTKRIRYIVALPLSIIFWFAATGLLIGIIVAVAVFKPPIHPGQTYSQGYWHAVIAAILYMIGSIILLINMLGYFLGKYPQHFELDDDQRTLILQTMMFFFWLAGGAAVFQKICGWTYADALYFCDATVLTVGFGDFVASNNTGRGLVFPYSVLGIIFLGLMINSIRKFAISMSSDNLAKAHENHQRERTIGRSVTSEQELREKLGLPPHPSSNARRPSNNRQDSTQSERVKRRDSLSQYGRFDIHSHQLMFWRRKGPLSATDFDQATHKLGKRVVPIFNKASHQHESLPSHRERNVTNLTKRSQKLLILREEKDRFDAMRAIQQNTKKFRNYTSLAMSLLAFGILWCVGALVFKIVEQRERGMSYFQALYFCYVSLLTIGYGDFAPKSNAGKAFFVFWSLLAIPTMTILISDMSDTVITAINRGTFKLADWTIMPKEGTWRPVMERHRRLMALIQNYNDSRQEKKRVERGFEIEDPDQDIEIGSNADQVIHPTLEKLAQEGTSEHSLASRLGIAIKRVAQDLHAVPPKKYSYEEWVQFTRLIKFSAESGSDLEREEEEQGLIEWDWIGEDSPMLSEKGEPQWVLDRLCESLNRYTRRQARKARYSHHTRGSSSAADYNLRHRQACGDEPSTSDSPVPDERDEASASGSSSSRTRNVAPGEEDGG